MALTSSQHQLCGILYLISGVIGTGTNCLMAFRFASRKSSPVGYPGNSLHVSLALAHLGIVGTFIVMVTCSFAERWLYGDLGCQLFGFSGILFGIASIHSQTVIAMERYLLACHRTSYNKLTSFHYKVALVVVWLGALVWAGAPLLGWSRYALEPINTHCTLDWSHPTDNYASHLICITIFAYAIPISTQIFCIVKAALTLKENNQSLNDKDLQHQCRLLKSIVLMVAMSLIGWTPYAILCMVPVVSDPANVDPILSAVPSLSAKMMVAVLPLAYVSGGIWRRNYKPDALPLKGSKAN